MTIHKPFATAADPPPEFSNIKTLFLMGLGVGTYYIRCVYVIVVYK